jgi:Glycerophosphoryl diester phosphodiesterase family
MRPALLLSLATAGVASAASSRGQLFPFVIGHRGIPSVYPENTVISFQAAVAAGVDGVESDLHFTKDNVLVLIHDDTLERTTNCTGYVWDYTLAQLSSCNANYPSVYGDKYGFVPIPTFESLVKLIAENNVSFLLGALANTSLEFDWPARVMVPPSYSLQIFFVMDLKADGHYVSLVPFASAESWLLYFSLPLLFHFASFLFLSKGFRGLSHRSKVRS